MGPPVVMERDSLVLFVLHWKGIVQSRCHQDIDMDATRHLVYMTCGKLPVTKALVSLNMD